jgi:hypothetical protein
MNHLTDNELVALYYDRADEPEIQKFEAHLATCAQCHQKLKRFSNFLDRIHIRIPEPPADYESQVWRRLRPRLPEKTRGRRLRWFARPEWVAAIAVTAVVLLAFAIGRWFERNVEFQNSNAANHASPGDSSPGAARERALLLAVGAHLERAQIMLIELTNTPPSPAIDLSAAQETARTLLPDNRLYRETATQLADAQIATLLDELERLLLDLSHRPSMVSMTDFDDIRDRIEAEGILFKVRIAGSQLRTRQANTVDRPPLAGGRGL